ncbi:MAG: SpoVR family protein [Candidatus Eisenbacteria bacterium]|nr:SpoVR family protein [Candidatus Eisenbacteria bacterium]
MSLPIELANARDEIRGIAKQLGLDFFETVYEVVSGDEMNEVAAYGGFPVRYPHWRFGMEYERLHKSHAYGLSKIYELVINNNPCIAYLQESNEMVDQKLVMAHVYGHCDFFKNNIYFAHTNRRMVDAMANHAAVVRRHMDRIGQERVEAFVDLALSLENLIDPQRVFLDQRPPAPGPAEEEAEEPQVQRIRAKEYLESFVNPPEFIAQQKKKLAEEKERRRRFPERPERDILLFLLYYAPLERWQQDIIEIVRNESYYFLPQMQTKVMNEGWASYWHSRIMTEHVLEDSEVVDYADHCAGVFSMPPGQFNPYKVGLELWRDIERRWDRGQFGKEWEECDDYETRLHWNTEANKGREKLFEVRRLYNDVTFIDTFLTPDFCDRAQLFVYKWNERTRRLEISDREFRHIKEQLLFSLTNAGQPIIRVEDGNFDNRGELLLIHDFQGVELDVNYARDTLRNLALIWNRPCHIRTQLGEKEKLFTHDGTDFREKVLDR